MRKKCIIFTCEYPFLTGESFLENEIGILAKNFDEVLIFSWNASKKMNMTRKVPQNTKVYPLGMELSFLRYPKYMFLGIINREKRLKLGTVDLKRILVSLYARGRANIVFKQIIKIIKTERVDVSSAVIYSYWFADQAIVAWRLKDYLRERGNNVHAVSRAHGYDLYWERNPLGYLPYQNVSLELLDSVHPCSEYGVDYLILKYPKHEKKISVARLGTLDHGFLNSCSTLNFVTCGNLHGFKRTLMFADAFSELVKKIPYCHWYCIGDGEEKNVICDLVRDRCISDNVTMLGQIPNEDVVNFYCRNEVFAFVNVSETEGMPVSIMEAMSFGIPIIATDAGGTKEIVNSSNGILLDNELTKDMILNAICTMIDLSGNEYRKLRISARNTWEEKCYAVNNYSTWCDYLIELVNQ